MSDKVYVLIDNDPLIRKSWEFAAKKSENELLTFASVASFLEYSENVPKTALIYIDSELDDNLRGEHEAQKIYKNGYENLYLATGSTFTPSELPSYIKEVCSKRAPF